VGNEKREVKHVQRLAEATLDEAPGIPTWEVLAALHSCGEGQSEPGAAETKEKT
jgi:hypothetical protein